AIDVEALSAAYRDVVARHETLRTVYPDSDAGPHQVIADAADVSAEVPVVAATSEQDVFARMAAMAGEGFDVTQAVPVRVACFELGATDHVLLMVVHHISADGASLAPLFADLMTAYAARSAGQAPTWEP